MLRIRPGSAAWVFRYTSPNGRRREMGLGPAARANSKLAGNGLTIAREQADGARAALARGEDPIEGRRVNAATARSRDVEQRTAKKVAALTLARAARDYHARIIEPSRSDKHAAQWIASLENHVGPGLWNASLASIDSGVLLNRLLELHREIPETTSRIRQRLDAVFDDAILRKLITSNPAKPLVRALREADGRRKAVSFRSLPFAQVPDFFRLISAQDGVAARALQFLVLTASRTDEVLSCEWTEFDLPGRRWTVPAARMKAREEHVVDLNEAAIAVIESMKLRPTVDETFVFGSPLRGKPLSNMALLMTLSRIGMRDKTTTHGLRGSFSTWAYESGKYRPDVIEAALAHREKDKIKAAYNRARFSAERGELMRGWGAFVTGNASSTKEPAGSQ